MKDAGICYKKTKLKPSDFCKQKLKMHKVKNYNFVFDYFSDTDCLLNVLKEYKNLKNHPKDELTLFDLLI